MDSSRQSTTDAPADADIDGFYRVGPLDDLWQGETALHRVGGVDVLVCHTESGGVHAVQSNCPHQAVALSGGTLDGDVITCPMHLWRMNVATGEGVNPCHARIARYPVRLVDGEIYVSSAGVDILHCRP